MFKRCGFAAHTKLVRRPTTLTGCVHVIFKVCCQEDARFGMRPTTVGGTTPWKAECIAATILPRNRDVRQTSFCKTHRRGIDAEFPNRLPYMAKRTSVSASYLLLRWWATVCSSRRACWRGARWETDLRWVVLNLVGGANGCLRTLHRLWQTMKTT